MLFGISSCAQEYSVEAQTFMVPMRDGIQLATDIYFPARDGKAVEGKFPVLVYRSPYGRTGGKGDSRYLAARGYVVLAQDVRGRFDSQGDFYAFIQEGRDGYDTIEWAAKQNWSNGKVGTFGASYLAWDQYFAAMYKPPHLVAMFALVGGANFYEDFAYPGGIPNLSWPIWMVKSALTSPKFGDKASKAVLAKILDNPAEWLRQTPGERAEVFRDFPQQARMYKDFYAHATLDAYWKQRGFYNLDSYSDFKDVPTLFLTGWYDYFAEGVLHNFEALSRVQKTTKKLIVGPWPHPTGDSSCGDVFFGDSAGVDQRALMADWFDHWMKQQPLHLVSSSPVRFFRMGGGSGTRGADRKLHDGGTWLDAASWPVPATASKYFLNGGSRLQKSTPTGPASSTLTYDPMNPAPTIGGRYGMGGWSPNCAQNQVCSTAFLGCKDNKPINQRPDVLSFVGEPLARSVEVTGAPAVNLWISSTARDTDFIVKLIDVFPDGYALILSEGQLRARYRDGFRTGHLLSPGEHYELRIKLASVSNLFPAGHRIRLDVTSSNFPKLEPNPNTGDPIGTWAHPVVAENVVYHSAEQPSYLELPVVTR
jgi:putative CocE/NonD family hydrolase